MRRTIRCVGVGIRKVILVLIVAAGGLASGDWGQVLAAELEVFPTVDAPSNESEPVPTPDTGPPLDTAAPSQAFETINPCDACNACQPCDCCVIPQCCCGPVWTFRAGAVFLEHSRPTSSPIVTTNGAVGAPAVVDASQLHPSAGWGYDLSAIRSNFLGGPRSLEIRYFGVYGFNANSGPTAVTAANGTPFVNNPLFVAGTGATFTNSYGSQLQSFEINSRRRRRDWLELLVGFRYIDLTEKMTDTFSFVRTGISTDNVRSFNSLWGAQVGADAFVWQRGRLAIDAITKVGIFDNNAGNSVVSTLASGTQLKSTAGLGQGTFVAEAGLSASYRVTQNWALRTTYQMLWLDGVALAPEQIRTAAPTVLPGGGGTVAMNNVFFNGFFLGMECKH
jgi:hypothetical protein